MPLISLISTLVYLPALLRTLWFLNQACAPLPTTDKGFLSHHGGFLFITEKHSTSPARLIFDAVCVHSRELCSPECVASSSFSAELLICSCATTVKSVHARIVSTVKASRKLQETDAYKDRCTSGMLLITGLYDMGKFSRVKNATLD